MTHRAAQQGDLARAQELFAATASRADVSDEERARAAFQLGKAQVQHCRFVTGKAREETARELVEQAAANFQSAFEQTEPSSILHAVAACEAAQIEYSRQRFEDAVTWFAKGFDQLPDEAEPMRSLIAATYGHSLFMAQRYSQAERLFDANMAQVQAVLGDDVICGPLVAYGVVAAFNGDVDFGREMLERGQAAAASANKSDTVILAKKFAPMVEKLGGCSTAPDWKEAGNEEFRENKYESAISLYTVALKLEPFDAKVLANRSLCHKKLNRNIDAIADARRSAKADTEYKRALILLATLAKDMGFLDEAKDACQRLLALDSEDTFAVNALKELQDVSEATTTQSVARDAHQASDVEDTPEPMVAVQKKQRESVRSRELEPHLVDAQGQPLAPADADGQEQVTQQHRELQSNLDELQDLVAERFPAFMAWFDALGEQAKIEHVKASYPFLVDKKGSTTDMSGADVSELAFLLPEATADALCRSQSGMRNFVMAVAAADDFADLLGECVNNLLDAAEFRSKTPRGQWLKATFGQSGTDLVCVRTGVQHRQAGTANNARLAAQLKTDTDARIVVPSKVHELSVARAKYMLQLPLSWITGWADAAP